MSPLSYWQALDYISFQSVKSSGRSRRIVTLTTLESKSLPYKAKHRDLI